MRRRHHRAGPDGHRRRHRHRDHHRRDGHGNHRPQRRHRRRRHHRDHRCGSCRRHHRDDHRRHRDPGGVRHRGVGRRDDRAHRDGRRADAEACCRVWHHRDEAHPDGGHRRRGRGADPADAEPDARPAARWRTGCYRRAEAGACRAWARQDRDADRGWGRAETARVPAEQRGPPTLPGPPGRAAQRGPGRAPEVRPEPGGPVWDPAPAARSRPTRCRLPEPRAGLVRRCPQPWPGTAWPERTACRRQKIHEGAGRRVLPPSTTPI